MKRSEVTEQYKWKLTDMYATQEAWEKDYAFVEAKIAEVAAYNGKLNTKADVLACLRLLDELNVRLELCYVYAHTLHDQDTKDEQATVLYNRINYLLSQVSTAISFFEPQLAALSEDMIRDMIADPDFSDYDYMLKSTLDSKPYILSEREERLMALTSTFTAGFSEVFSMINNADLNLDKVTVDGEEQQLTHGLYSRLMQDHRQDVRKYVFETYYKAFERLLNTLATNYYNNVKKDVFFAQARGYKSFLDKVMHAEDVPVAVYETLIKNIEKTLPAMHEYIALRKKMLGVDKIYMSDMNVSIVKDVDLGMDYEDACKLVLEAVKPLGEEYCSHIADAFRDGWIDVYETDGKRSGAYCTHANAAPHPYVLLNYSRTTHDVFTIAHELGHAMHSFYSAANQPVAKADYKIFVAEVASTTNEMLLLAHLLNTVTDKNVRKFLLSYRLDMIRTTIFRQTMFSEFELDAHTKVERGEPLTAAGMSQFYAELNRKYYGPEIEPDDHICHEWTRIPHFFYSFYVYKYATGLTAATALSQGILAG